MRRVGLIGALIVLHRTYRTFPMRERTHVLIRFLTCPFLRVLRHLPANATLLDIGAGHGLFSVLAREHGAHVALQGLHERRQDPLGLQPEDPRSAHPFATRLAPGETHTGTWGITPRVEGP